MHSAHDQGLTCANVHSRSTTGRTRKGVRVQSWAPRWGAATLQHHAPLGLNFLFGIQSSMTRALGICIFVEGDGNMLLINFWINLSEGRFCGTLGDAKLHLFVTLGVCFLLVEFSSYFLFLGETLFTWSHLMLSTWPTHCVSLECKNLCVCLFMCVSVCLRKTLVSTNTLRFCSTLRSVSLCICAVSPISTHLKLCNPVETMQHSVSATYISAVFPSICSIFLCLCKSIYICLCKRFLASEISIEEE